MTFKKIFKAFPPPKLIDIPFAGLSLSDSALRCIQFGKKDNNLYIEKYTEVSIPDGVIVSGQVNKTNELTKILTDLKSDLKLEYVKIALPEEKAYLFTTKIPMVKNEEVVSVIESKIEENVPVSPAELVFDYKLIDHRQKSHIDVVVSALPISVVDTYVEMAEKAGLSLLSLEIESQAAARSLILRHDTGTVLIINFGPGKVGLYVATDRIIRFTSTVSTKGETLSFSEFLVQEVKKLYIYWHTLKENIDKPEKKINRIIICGESFPEDALQFLASRIQTPVTLGNVWCNSFDINNVVPEISFDDSLRYSAAVGLALPSDIFI